VSPGTDRAPLARGSESTDALHLVTVATLNPGKGHDVLFRALAALTDRPADARPTSDSSVGAAGHWRLTCAGSAARHPATAKRLRALLSELALTDRVTLAGELDAAATAALYDDADLAVLPTLSESHSLAAAEALARGIPVVGTRTGAIPDLVGEGDTAAGLLVEPGDVEALRDAVAHVIDDPCCRARLAEGARRVRENLRTWDDAVREMDSLMVSLSNHDLGAHPSTGSG
jgi:glycosyltransferase involved in cell wall biosynthesis